MIIKTRRRGHRVTTRVRAVTLGGLTAPTNTSLFSLLATSQVRVWPVEWGLCKAARTTQKTPAAVMMKESLSSSFRWTCTYAIWSFSCCRYAFFQRQNCSGGRNDINGWVNLVGKAKEAHVSATNKSKCGQTELPPCGCRPPPTSQVTVYIHVCPDSYHGVKEFMKWYVKCIFWQNGSYHYIDMYDSSE